ncbi:SpaA isopeptide-forming pilin-related protein [Companilactobacillus zhongbaensis]|uniref:SpaA isopeptide-forming pilin-related protein n=1 Tax=Companilactobacillus zhongbaensis TaxID=2486009 RepID=UPI000F7B28F3|nr:SpaA isopeptide-forming pilin-related protein [Companilactobacillus zhongbaensis]
MKHRQIVNVISMLTIFFATLTIALFQVDQAKATAVTISGADSTSATITDLNGKNIDHATSIPDWQTVSLSYQWSIPNTTQIASGDTATFTLPSNVAANSNLQVPIKDNAGNSVGTFAISKGAQVGTLTFSQEFTTDTENRSGTLQFYVNGTKTDGSEQNFSVNKYGWISGYDAQNAPNELTWNIALDSSGKELTNVTLVDTMGPGQTFVPNSIVANTGYYSNGQFVNTGVITPIVSVSGNTIKMSFAKIYSAVNLTYTAQVAPDASAQNVGWDNDVTMTCDQGGGVSTSSSHKIEWGGVGSGNGEVDQGSVILTNTNAKDGTPITNSTFDLYDNNDKVVKTNLTTDSKGQINLTALPAGNYYFVQTKTPPNYTLNDQKFPFTITGGKVATVSVTNLDPPTTQPVDPTDPDPVDPPATVDPTDPDPVDPPATVDPTDPDPVAPPTTVDPTDPDPVDPPATVDPTDPDPTNPPVIVDPSTPDPVDPSDPSAGQPVLPDLSTNSGDNNTGNTHKVQNAIFIGDPIVIGDPPVSAKAKPVYYASSDNDSFRSRVFPSRSTGDLPQTGNDKNDSFLQSVVGVIILFIIGSEYLFWKKSKG